jgi:tryptophanyl-tRNA synthetase
VKKKQMQLYKWVREREIEAVYLIFFFFVQKSYVEFVEKCINGGELWGYVKITLAQVVASLIIKGEK